MHDESLEDTVLINTPVASVRPAVDNDDTVLVGRRHAGGHRPVSAEIAEPATQHREADTPAPRVPAVHSFRIAGETVSLDKPAYIGRRPSPPRVVVGAAPRLIQVPSAKREVSGTHLEIRQHGSNVVVSDLGSSNGTVVTIPGRPAQRMRRGEPLVVTPGTLVDIGDGNLIEILSEQRS
ncbi:MAG: FHA domain-containing protein [Glaciihabitans sp.]